MKYYTSIVFNLCLVCCSFSTAIAQNHLFQNNINAEVYEKADKLLQAYQQLQPSLADKTKRLSHLDAFLNFEFVATGDLKKQWLLEQMAINQKKLGVRVTAGFSSNDSERGIAEVDLGTRARVGLEWNILGDGLLTRFYQKEVLQKEYQVLQLENTIDQKEKNYPYWYNQIIWAFNKEKTRLIEQRLQFLHQLIDIKTTLYYTHDLAYTEVLECKKRIEENQVLLNSYQSFNKAYEQAVSKEALALQASLLPVVEIDLDKLLHDPNYKKLQQELTTTKMEQIDLEHKANRDIRLKAFANYNYQSSSFLPTNSHLSFGVNMSLPLDLSLKNKEEVRNLEKQLLLENENYALYNNSRELMNLYQEYNYKLKQYINFSQKKVHLDEKIRVEMVLLKTKKQQYSPMNALSYQDEKLAVEMELIDLKQMLYLYLIKIYAIHFNPHFSRCLSPIDLKEIGQKLPGKRYAWFDEMHLNKMNFDFYIEYLRKNELTTVLMPNQTSTQWIKLLKETGIRVFLETKGDPFASYPTELDGTFYKVEQGKTVLVIWDEPVKSKEIVAIVNCFDFNHRNHLENWIAQKVQSKEQGAFLFRNLKYLIETETKDLTIN